MKRTIVFIAVVCISLLPGCSNKKKQEITITNTSDTDLTDKAVTIRRNELRQLPQGDVYPLLTREGSAIPAQTDDTDDDGQWDELFFVIDLKAGQSAALTLAWTQTKPAYPVRTSVRFGKRDSKEAAVYPKTIDTIFANQVHRKLGYQPYQTDGPSWENDKVGFRHYLDGRNSKDLFGKKVSYMSPDSVGINQKGAVEDNYHVMADWGRDVLAVGNSVGIGGITLMIGDSLPRMGCLANDTTTSIESSVFKIVKEGPVRSILNFKHNNWKPLDRTYQVEEITTIWPGMYAFQNTAKVSGLKGDETLLVGLVNSNTPDPLKEIIVNDRWVVLLTHDQQSYDRQWWLGLALILPKEIYLGYGEAPKTGKFSNTFFGKLNITNDRPVTYYAAGCWELSDEGFKDPAYFENHIINLVRQLDAGVNVEIK